MVPLICAVSVIIFNNGSSQSFISSVNKRIFGTKVGTQFFFYSAYHKCTNSWTHSAITNQRIFYVPVSKSQLRNFLFIRKLQIVGVPASPLITNPQIFHKQCYSFSPQHLPILLLPNRHIDPGNI